MTPTHAARLAPAALDGTQWRSPTGLRRPGRSLLWSRLKVVMFLADGGENDANQSASNNQNAETEKRFF